MAKEETTPSSYDVFFAMLQEIQKYKWIESQKQGEDIGFERALTEWSAKHGSTWKKEFLKSETLEEPS